MREKMKGPDLRVTIWALWFSPREWAGYKSQGTQVNEAWGQDLVHEKKKRKKSAASQQWLRKAQGPRNRGAGSTSFDSDILSLQQPIR